MFKRGLLLMAFVLSISMVACNGGDKTNTLDASTAKDSTVNGKSDVIQPKATADVVKPLVTPAPANFIFPEEGIRPVAVMIDNEGTKSLPQGGLNNAQVIYEMVAEGGETRLMPVFWGTDPKLVGPVRSSRHYFLDYSMEHDAIYVHFGWSPMAKRDISKLKINNINGVANGGEIFWDLTRDRYNWQDSYTSMEKVLSYAKRVKYRANTDKKHVFTYNKSDMELSSGKSASKISLAYSASYKAGFTYDGVKNSYLRFRKGQPQIERVSGKQLEAKNIIIQLVKSGTILGDDKGRQQLINLGKGRGWFITNGKAVEITWSKESRASQTKYIDKNGNAVVLNPGQTWVQIVPEYGKVTID
ncbi:MAG: DUF3048 domain-containing protein [Clostridia bacterium]|nr:DUF3048 domain-containing protein [Clostridia bacterium]